MGRDDEPKGFIEEAFEHWQHQAEAEAEAEAEAGAEADAEPDADLDAVGSESVAGAAGDPTPAASPALPGIPTGAEIPAAGTGDTFSDPVAVDIAASAAVAVEPETDDDQVAADATAPLAGPVVDTAASAAAREPLTAVDAALVEEAAKKSGLVWIRTARSAGGQAVWHSWTDGAMYVLTGGVEQPDPGLADTPTTVVLLRSKDNMARLVSCTFSVETLRPDDPDWTPATADLAKGRLNLPEPATAPDRWASDDSYRIYRLRPFGSLLERPGAYDDDSHRATPVPSVAATAGAPPKVVHRRHPTGRPLS